MFQNQLIGIYGRFCPVIGHPHMVSTEKASPIIRFNIIQYMTHSSIEHRNYFQTLKGHVIWII